MPAPLRPWTSNSKSRASRRRCRNIGSADRISGAYGSGEHALFSVEPSAGFAQSVQLHSSAPNVSGRSNTEFGLPRNANDSTAASTISLMAPITYRVIALAFACFRSHLGPGSASGEQRIRAGVANTVETLFKTDYP